MITLLMIIILNFRYPEKLLSEIAMQGDQFWTDVVALVITLVVLKVAAYFLLRWKIIAVR